MIDVANRWIHGVERATGLAVYPTQCAHPSWHRLRGKHLAARPPAAFCYRIVLEVDDVRHLSCRGQDELAELRDWTLMAASYDCAACRRRAQAIDDRGLGNCCPTTIAVKRPSWLIAPSSRDSQSDDGNLSFLARRHRASLLARCVPD